MLVWIPVYLFSLSLPCHCVKKSSVQHCDGSAAGGPQCSFSNPWVLRVVFFEEPGSCFKCLPRVECSSDLFMIGGICKLFTPFLFPAAFLTFARVGYTLMIVRQEWRYRSPCWVLEGVPPAMCDARDRNP